jgi:uroporphyrinogen decarboxylase
MTHKDRFLAALNRQPVDRLAYGDGLWGETSRKYVAGGKMAEKEDPVTHFDTSWRTGGWINCMADLDFKEVIVEETADTVLKLTGNGAKLRWWKNKAGTPEHVDFSVKDRDGWERLVRPHLLKPDRRRIPFEDYRKARKAAAAENRAFLWAGIAPFEQMHPMCGHEYMLMGMALDPDWVRDMVSVYADLTLMHMDILFAEEGLPDAFWFYEDMGFKEKPFMSPEMYKDIIQPGHAKLFDYAHSKGRKVVVHSCGYVAPLVPGLVAAGMDCLQAMEVKAGMDLPTLAKAFGDRIAFCGGVDIRVIARNDRQAIDAEINRKVRPVLEMGSGYILHSDHSIPPDVEHDTLAWFFQHGSRLPERMRRHRQP